MAKSNSKEFKYKKALESLDIYHPAMDGLIHDLAVLERECSRTRALWKKTAAPGAAPSALDPYYAAIRQQQRDILALREALGLTPRSLRRLKGAGVYMNKPVADPEPETRPPTILGFVLDKRAAGEE